jgi:hypothetical protein
MQQISTGSHEVRGLRGNEQVRDLWFLSELLFE